MKRHTVAFGFIVGLFLAVGASSTSVSALQSSNIQVTPVLGTHSASSYPLSTIDITVTLTPESSDIGHAVGVLPVISKYDPGSSPELESSWAADTDTVVEPKTVTFNSSSPVSLTFKSPFVKVGANYFGCVSVRDDYTDANPTAPYMSLCGNSTAVTYTGNLLPVWRFYNKSYTSYFYTIDHAEKMNLINTAPSWLYQTAAFNTRTSQTAGSMPLYRFWSKTKKTHYYTASRSERDALIKNYDDSVWKYEKVAYYVAPFVNSACPSGTGPVFRFWSSRYQTYYYTKSAIERKKLISNYADDVWKYQGTSFCAW